MTTEAPEKVATAAPAEEATADGGTSITTGSGDRFTTTVDRATEGELSPEDFRQVSLLTSRVVRHMNSAVLSVEDGNREKALADIDKCQTLIGVVRELLPSTVVTTIVRDTQGQEVYREVDRVQNDRVPLYEGLIALEVLEPISDAKAEQAAIQGVRLAEADLMHTSVLVELPYVERKLKAARRHLDDGALDLAAAQLVLAQTRGVSYQVNEKDDPLVKTHLALQLAERMVEQDRPQAATANLQVAQNYLAVYRALLGGDEAQKLLRIEDQVNDLIGDVSQDDAAAKIRHVWDQVIALFSQETGEAQPTAQPAEVDGRVGDALNETPSAPKTPSD